MSRAFVVASVASLAACAGGSTRPEPVTVTLTSAPSPEVVVAEAPRATTSDDRATATLLDADEPRSPTRSRPGVAANPSASGAAPTPGPKAVISLMRVTVSGGGIANASAVVAGMAAGFRRCVTREIGANPSAISNGGVKLTAKIGVNGEVLSATPTGGAGLTKAAIACMLTRVTSAQFTPPDGGSATIEIPIVVDLL